MNLTTLVLLFKNAFMNEKTLGYFIIRFSSNIFLNNIALEINDFNIIISPRARIAASYFNKGRGLDYFHSLSGIYFQVGENDLDLRPCLETKFDFIKNYESLPHLQSSKKFN